MESDTNRGNDQNTPLSGINLKLESLDDDFYIDNLLSSKGYNLQDFQNQVHFPITASSFIPDIGLQTNGYDPFDPFFHGCATDFGVYDFKPYDENDSIGAAMHDLQGGGFLNFSDRNDSLMEMETVLKYHDARPLRFTNVPDEGSCVTADNIGHHKGDGKKRSKIGNNSETASATAKKGGKGRKNSKAAKGQWTAEEDRVLILLVEKYGERKWSNIAQMMKGRIGKQCRERWHNHLRPNIKKEMWTEEEDRILIDVHAKVGNKWAEIAKSLPGRTENSIKNHWNATKRRQFARRKCRTKWPKPSSVLQNYIKSLNLEKTSSSRSKNVQPSSAADAVAAPQQAEIDVFPDDDMVQEFELDEVPEFTFDDDDDDHFDVELLPDMPQLMHCEGRKEVDFFGGIV
ncbi:Transcription factor [Sesamum alatum]|uniref:Transcription factor n=1 Tax=Sesamum alatum TaxID=300844 RepID=A0AAE2CM23_9LAMI|nr:Transcription factor [Sesamum alatum]